MSSSLPISPADLSKTITESPSTTPSTPSTPSPISSEDISSLIDPISAEQHCGTSLESDPVITQIRLIREEDDPTLPMRQWERPLRSANWPLIEKLCSNILQNQSKDLQIACWLLESWTRQYSLLGLLRGLRLIKSLITNYWDDLFPVLERDAKTGELLDCAARSAPLKWLNQAIPLTLRIHVSLTYLDRLKPKYLTLSDWERLTANELLTNKVQDTKNNKKKSLANEEEKTLTRTEAIAYAKEYQGKETILKIQQIQSCKELLTQIDSFVDERLGLEGPSFSKLLATFDEIERVLNQIAPPYKEQTHMDNQTEHSDKATYLNPHHATSIDNMKTPFPDNSPLISGLSTANTEGSAAPNTTTWTDRKKAYDALRSIADFLSHEEPHSITPYLLRKAIYWGEMPLHDLLDAIMKTEGDWANLVRIFEIKK